MTFIKAFETVWSPGVLLLLQALWAVLFVYTGCSMTAAARLPLHTSPERI